MPSTQINLHFKNKQEASESANLLEEYFLPHGIPVATFENQEGAGWLVDLYFESEDTQSHMAEVMDVLGEDASYLSAQARLLPDTDWVTQSLEGLGAVKSGRFVVHGLHAKKSVHESDIGLHIEASRAFGTGHHATTEGCLQAIDHLCQRFTPSNALDLGCGTAILGIALAKLAKCPVIASDIDAVSVRISNENVLLNHVKPFIRCLEADGLHHQMIQQQGPYDCIIANILAGPLIQFAPALAKLSEKNTHLILSGLLKKQQRAVMARYRSCGFVLSKAHYIHGWATLTLIYKG